ncbi:acetoacetyl-CoA synthetase [Alteribacillus persepolensis]|uniref:Acetoacetyl-CoA synthetase n=1 Tax=Alteribacillus persepolensis TaxID=568899 RepID=A0A1G8GN02_9BACI|nr:acetoacetate--CoA ligase [Alteribacillus persepolensis]SDH95697.1 acetoacetyl-CoA synthetase [Alteribacillus persepolensis]
MQEGTFLWQPSQTSRETSQLTRYMKWLEKEKGVTHDNYEELWNWSVTDIEHFWESLWEFFDIKSSTSYTEVLDKREMPGNTWFEGAALNYAEQVFRDVTPSDTAIVSKSELRPLASMSWQELYELTSSIASALKAEGVTRGDRVVAYMPNIPETVAAFLACASIGAIWSSCSPDFGSPTVIDRFQQIEPKVLLAVDGYRYGGKNYHRIDAVKEIQKAIPSLKQTVILSYLSTNVEDASLKHAVSWQKFLNKHKGAALNYEALPFQHPLWVLYSSGTTGLPKAIVHSQGGIVLEHLKQVALQMDIQKGDRFFWFTTTGWMMWNLLVGGLLNQAAILLYDGSPAYPNLDVLWKFAEETEMNVFGTSASYLLSCKKRDVSPKDRFSLEKLRSIGSTGSPLPPEGFQWVYENVKSDVWLFSTSGGTDICSSFVTGSPLHPVHAGMIQCRSLGAKVEAFDEKSRPLTGEVGELIVGEPLPSMPIYFWNDPGNKRYLDSYFSTYSGVWRHGDWIKINRDGSCQIYGRSDSTINRGGIRMGTSEIYSAVEDVEGIRDSIIVDISHPDGQDFMPLFVVLEEGRVLDTSLKKKVNDQIKSFCSPRHVPNAIYEINEVPRTLNGKKLEVPLKKILMGTPVEKAVNIDSVTNKKALDYFAALAENITMK